MHLRLETELKETIKDYHYCLSKVQSLIITGSFSLVFLAIFSIWSNSFRRGFSEPTKLGNFVA